MVVDCGWVVRFEAKMTSKSRKCRHFRHQPIYFCLIKFESAIFECFLDDSGVHTNTDKHLHSLEARNTGCEETAGGIWFAFADK